MKRGLAIVIFLVGGFAAEWAHPARCPLIASDWTQNRRRPWRGEHGQG